MLQDGYANANSLSLHYIPSGEGDLILFLHGFPEFWYAGKSQLAEFGKDYHAVALDLPGYNLSDKPEELSAYEAQNIADDVCAFARQLSPSTKFVSVGHDWGATSRGRSRWRTPRCSIG